MKTAVYILLALVALAILGLVAMKLFGKPKGNNQSPNGDQTGNTSPNNDNQQQANIIKVGDGIVSKVRAVKTRIPDGYTEIFEANSYLGVVTSITDSTYHFRTGSNNEWATSKDVVKKYIPLY